MSSSFGANRARLQQQRSRQRTKLAALAGDDSDSDCDSSTVAAPVKAPRSAAAGSASGSGKPVLLHARVNERAKNVATDTDDDDDDDNDAAPLLPIKRLVAVLPLAEIAPMQEDAARYTSDDLAQLRAGTQFLAPAPRIASAIAATGDSLDDDDDGNDAAVDGAALGPPPVRILEEHEIARAKQMKAAARNSDTFMALDPKRQTDAAPSKSDLMAERIALTVAGLQRGASAADVEHDAEVARWELRNVHAGGGGAHAIGNALRQAATSGAAPANVRVEQRAVSAVDALVATECESVSVDQVLGDMTAAIAALQDRCRANERREALIVSTRDETVVAIADSEKARNKVLVRTARAAEMRDYVTDLLDCLAAKETELAALEETAVGLIEQQRSMRRKRRALDVADVWRAIDRDSAPDADVGDVDAAALREQRRQKRLVRAALTGGEVDADDLDDDDDANATEIEAQARESLLHVRERAATLFDEADEQYRSIGEICAHFDAWRSEYTEDYARAFAGLSLPAVLLPFVRAHLLSIERSHWLLTPEAIERVPAVDVMRRYPSGGATTVPINAEDEPPLLTTTVRLLLKEHLVAAIRRTLDLAAPTPQVAAFSTALRSTLAHPYGSAMALKRAVAAALDAAFAAELALVQLPTHALRSTAAGAPMRAFAAAQLRRYSRLFCNMMLLCDLGVADELRQRAIGELLNQKLVPLLRNVDFATPTAALDALRVLLLAIPRVPEDRVPSDLAIVHQLAWTHFQLAQRSPLCTPQLVQAFQELLRHVGGGAALK